MTNITRKLATTAGVLLLASALGCASTAATLYAVASIYRHDRFASGGYDLGLFDQTLWGYSRLELVPNSNRWACGAELFTMAPAATLPRSNFVTTTPPINRPDRDG